MPHFQDQLATPAASCDWVTGSGSYFVNQAATSIMKAIQDHAEEKASKQTSVS
jgi:limonene 1,2-monooxygenase